MRRNRGIVKQLKVLAYLLVFLALLTSTCSDEYYSIDPWYPIPQIEKEMCLRWGGATSSETSENKGYADYITEVTVTIQAQKTGEPDNRTFYEVGYYVESLMYDVEYSVDIFSSITGEREEIKEKTTVPSLSRNAEYKTLSSEKEFDRAEIRFKQKNEVWKKLTVSIVEKER